MKLLEFPSKITLPKFSWEANFTAHSIALASAYTRVLVSAFLKVVNTTNPLQSLATRVFAVRFDSKPFLAPLFAVWFSQNHNYTTPHFCNHMCGVV